MLRTNINDPLPPVLRKKVIQCLSLSEPLSSVGQVAGAPKLKKEPFYISSVAAAAIKKPFVEMAVVVVVEVVHQHSELQSETAHVPVVAAEATPLSKSNLNGQPEMH